MHDKHDERSFSSDHMHRIILRASEIQRDRPERISAERLREIAADVGIDAQALAKAIEQVDRESPAVVAAAPIPQAERSVVERLGPFASSALGWALGGGSGLLRQMNGASFGDVATLLATIWLGITALLLALAARRTGSQRDFQLRSAALWTGFTAGFALAYPRLAEDVLLAGIVLGLCSAVVGAAIVTTPKEGEGFFTRLRRRLRRARPVSA